MIKRKVLTYKSRQLDNLYNFAETDIKDSRLYKLIVADDTNSEKTAPQNAFCV